jgi:hypothetical protein
MKFARLLLLVAVSFFMLSGYVQAAQASKFKVQVVPMGCQFTVIDTGTNEIEYLTPAACGQAVPSPSTNSDGPPLPGLPEQLDIPPELTAILQNEPEDAPIIINLEEFVDYVEGRERKVSLSLRHVVRFIAHNESNDESHSITVKEIGRDYVVLTIASEPFDTRLYVGNQNQYDVTGDGIYDIEVTLRSISGGVADIVFRDLSPTDTKQAIATATATPLLPKSSSKWPYAVAGVVALAFVGLVMRKRYMLQSGKG